MLLQEISDRVGIDRNEGAKSPREPLGHHFVGIRDKAFAEVQRPKDITASSSRSHVQRDRRDDGSPSPPTISGAGPPFDRSIRDSAFPPGLTGKVGGERIHRSPVVHATAEFFESLQGDRFEGSLVPGDELVGDLSSLEGVAGEDCTGEVEDSGRRMGLQELGERSHHLSEIDDRNSEILHRAGEVVHGVGASFGIGESSELFDDLIGLLFEVEIRGCSAAQTRLRWEGIPRCFRLGADLESARSRLSSDAESVFPVGAGMSSAGPGLQKLCGWGERVRIESVYGETYLSLQAPSRGF